MKVQITTIWKLHGASKLTTEKAALELVRLSEPALAASVTENAEPYFEHIDRATALANLLLMGLFAREKDGTPEERLASELVKVRARREKQTEKGVFLILEGTKDIQEPNFEIRHDLKDFSICFDAIEKPGFRESFRPEMQAVLTAIVLSLPANADRQVEMIGEVIYLIDPENGKPIYTFSTEGGSARLSVASPLTEGIALDAERRLPKILKDRSLTRPAHLLMTSLNRGTDALLAFIAAWTALEMFINTNFKANYESQWFSIKVNGAPLAAKPEFERFKDKKSAKYSIADKFSIIATVLDGEASTTDADEFAKLKDIRDKLLHKLKTPPQLPTKSVQKLLLKYLALQLDRLE